VRAVTDGCEQNHEWHPQYTLIDDVGAPTDTEIAAERKHTADHFDIFEPIRFWAFPGYLAGPLCLDCASSVRERGREWIFQGSGTLVSTTKRGLRVLAFGGNGDRRAPRSLR